MGGVIPAPNIVADANQISQNPLAEYARATQLGQEQQQFAQEQQQRAMQTQMMQQQLNDQKAMTAAMQKWNGQDFGDLANLARQNGISGQGYFDLQQKLLARKQQVASLQGKDLDNLKSQNTQNANGIAPLIDPKSVADADLPTQIHQVGQGLLQSGTLDPQHEQEIERIAQLAQTDPNSARQQLDMHRKAWLGESALAENFKNQQQGVESGAKAANEDIQTKLNEIKYNLAKNSKPGDFDSQVDSIYPPQGLQTGGTNRMIKTQVNSALSRGDIDGARKYIDQALENQLGIQKDIAVQTNPQIQQGKVNVAVAEGKARQLIQGMTEPVYAYLPNGSKQLMSKTDALQSGIRNMVPVGEKDISDDTMLINRLGDVRQKIAEYEHSLQEPISAKDQGNMAALLDTQKLKGPFGIDFPTGRFDAALSADNLKGLSSNARDQLVAYRNAREALVGYNRVLSGSGRSNEQALNLQEQTLPDPSISDRDFSQRSIGAFRRNLNIVGQGLPNIPGVKSPEEWESQVAPPPQPSSTRSSGWGSQFGGVPHP